MQSFRILTKNSAETILHFRTVILSFYLFSFRHQLYIIDSLAIPKLPFFFSSLSLLASRQHSSSFLRHRPSILFVSLPPPALYHQSSDSAPPLSLSLTPLPPSAPHRHSPSHESPSLSLHKAHTHLPAPGTASSDRRSGPDDSTQAL